MYQKEYYVIKDSGTYSNTLEAYGLAVFLSKILGEKPKKVKIRDIGTHYVVELTETITESLIQNTRYFSLFPFIKFKDNEPPKGVEYFDYEKWKEIKEQFQNFLSKNPKPTHNEITNYEPKTHDYWDIYSSIIKLKVYDSYIKIFTNIYKNKDEFKELIKIILQLYSSIDDNKNICSQELSKLEKTKVFVKTEPVNALQMLNPHQGKGVNSNKANGISKIQMKTFWLSEYMKIIGCFNSMVVKNVKISNNTWDTKIYVTNPLNFSLNNITAIQKRFRSTLSANASLKLDISCILNYVICFIKNTEEMQGEDISELKNIYNNYIDKFISGFHLAYFKKLGTSEAISNLAFLELPLFVKITGIVDGSEWIEILTDHQSKLTRNSFPEAGLGLEVLQAYRQFITTNKLEYFLDALCLYSQFLMQELSKKKPFVYPFRTKFITKFFQLTKEYYMKTTNQSLLPIFETEGFSNISSAIRYSTISLQFTPKANRLYEIRYGLAQDLKQKSAYRDELVEYLMCFITSYNQENAKLKEKKGKDFITRSTIKQQDIIEIINLIDKYGCNIIGKLLIAYGYSLDRKEKTNESEILTTVEENDNKQEN